MFRSKDLIIIILIVIIIIYIQKQRLCLVCTKQAIKNRPLVKNTKAQQSQNQTLQKPFLRLSGLFDFGRVSVLFL